MGELTGTTGHHVKRGDARTLQWNLGRDLTGVTAAKVIIRSSYDATAVVARNGIIDDPAAGLVSLTLGPADYQAGALEGAPYPGRVYRVEIETQPGPITHPDDGYEQLTVIADLG